MSDADLASYFVITEYGPSNAKPIFIFGGWLSRPVYYSQLIKQLTFHGYRCVLYIPRRKLIAVGTSYTQVVNASALAVKSAQQRLSSYEGNMAAVFGVSIGTAFALEVSKRCKQVKRVVLLAPVGDFEKHIEMWQKQPYFKKIVASQPTEVAESGRILNQIGALKRIDLLKDKEILIGFAKGDRILHYEIAKELIARLRAINVIPAVFEVKGGHNIGLLRYAFNKVYIPFLTKTDT